MPSSLFGPEPSKVDHDLNAMLKLHNSRQKEKAYGHGIPTWSPYHHKKGQGLEGQPAREVLPIEFREIPKEDLEWQLDALRGTGMSAGQPPMGSTVSPKEIANEMKGTTGGSPHWSPYYRPMTKMEQRAAKMKAKRAARLAKKARRQQGLAEDPEGFSSTNTGPSSDIEWHRVLDKVAESMITNPGITDQSQSGNQTKRPVAPKKGHVPHYLRPKDEFTPWVEPMWQKKVSRRPQSASYVSRSEVEARCMNSSLQLTRKQIDIAEKAHRSNLPTNSKMGPETLDQLYRKAETLEIGTVRSTLRTVTAAIKDRQEKERRARTAPGGLRRPLSGALDPSLLGVGTKWAPRRTRVRGARGSQSIKSASPATSPIQR